jgi:hypothetical protein
MGGTEKPPQKYNKHKNNNITERNGSRRDIATHFQSTGPKCLTGAVGRENPIHAPP